MTVVVTKNTKKKELTVAIHNLQKNMVANKKPMSAFFGKYKTKSDGLAVQKKIRTEWN
jgi:hypothetical protein